VHPDTSAYRTIELAFFRPVDCARDGATCKDKLINLLAVAVTKGDYSHVELLFVENDLSFSVANGNRPHLVPKGYSSVDYDFQRITVTVGCYRLMMHHADRLTRDVEGFNECGAWFNFLPCFSFCAFTGGDGKRMFCSQAIATVLQQGEVLPADLRPECTSPNDIYRILQPTSLVVMHPRARANIESGITTLSMGSIAPSRLGALPPPPPVSFSGGNQYGKFTV